MPHNLQTSSITNHMETLCIAIIFSNRLILYWWRERKPKERHETKTFPMNFSCCVRRLCVLFDCSALIKIENDIKRRFNAFFFLDRFVAWCRSDFPFIRRQAETSEILDELTMFISLNVLLSFYLFSLYLETGSLHCHCCCYCWSSSHFSVCVFFSLSLSSLCSNKPLPKWWQWNYDTYQINKSVYLFDMKLRNKWQETKKKRHLSLRATNNMTIKKVDKTEKRGKKYIFFSEIVNWQYRRKVQHKIHNDSEIIEFMCWGFVWFYTFFILCFVYVSA